MSDTITVKTVIRLKRRWSESTERMVSLETAAELYKWVYNHPSYSSQFENAKIGQEVLVHLYGTITELCEVWKLAGLSDEQINDLSFWKG